MSYFSGPYRAATVLTVLSAVLYLTSFLVSGVVPLTLVLVGVGLVFLMLSGGLSRGRRGMAWLAFFISAIGAIYALAHVWSPVGLPVWWWQIIAIVQALIAVSLFVPLWRANPAAAQDA